MNNIAGTIFYSIMDAILILLALAFMSTDFEENIEEMESNLLKTVIINGEERTITDYSMWNENYTLDNGTTLHATAFKRLMDKEYGN